MATGFLTDTTVCIGCKACEVACKQWNQLPADGYEFTGDSYDNTAQLSGTTWRHVAFIENPKKKKLTGDVDLTALAEDVRDEHHPGRDAVPDAPQQLLPPHRPRLPGPRPDTGSHA